MSIVGGTNVSTYVLEHHIYLKALGGDAFIYYYLVGGGYSHGSPLCPARQFLCKDFALHALSSAWRSHVSYVREMDPRIKFRETSLCLFSFLEADRYTTVVTLRNLSLPSSCCSSRGSLLSSSLLSYGLTFCLFFVGSRKSLHMTSGDKRLSVSHSILWYYGYIMLRDSRPISIAPLGT